MSCSIWLCSKWIIFFSTSQIFHFLNKICEKRGKCFFLTVYYPPLLATLFSLDNSEFESCQLCGHEQGLLDELVLTAAKVLCQSTALFRTLTFIGIVRASYDHVY